MGTYVLVHGAWHGNWCWDKVADTLRAAGHTVRAPTLTGLGELADQLAPDVGLDTHVEDVADAVRASGPGVVLVGHSYSGMVVTGAAGLLPDRIARLVVIDGFLPERGEAALSLLPDQVAAHYRDSAAQRGGGWRVPPRPLANLGVTDERVIATVTGLLTDHPLRTYQDESRYGASELGVSGTYLLCTGWASPFRPQAQRAATFGWSVGELDADHEVPVSDPELLAARLLAEADPGDSVEEASA
ncbi:MAG TPA: alpha/beta hydrolase family protein [Pseudonocardiaceae bacterium]|nr:alpha/beta hydrolase family protein [Pseudonocardiaceae bacterium]